MISNSPYSSRSRRFSSSARPVSIRYASARCELRHRPKPIATQGITQHQAEQRNAAARVWRIGTWVAQDTLVAGEATDRHAADNRSPQRSPFISPTLAQSKDGPMLEPAVAIAVVSFAAYVLLGNFVTGAL